MRYHLELTATGCKATGVLNGFAAFELETLHAVNFAPPINAFLVGKDNQLIVRIEPTALPGDQVTTPSDMMVSGAVRLYQPGAIIEPGGGEELLALALAHPERGALHLPLALTASFDADGESFRERLLEAPVLTDAEPIRRYGLQLRDLFVAGDIDGLVAALTPKRLDYARACGADPLEMERDLRTFLQDMVLPAVPDLDFGLADIQASPSCGGRIWRVARSSGAPLIATAEDADGGHYVMDFHVGQVDGALRVVR